MRVKIVLLILIYQIAFLLDPAQANDSIAAIGVGGITFQKSHDIRLLDEKLMLSPKLVSVEYIFKNESSSSIQALVAFPIPALTDGLWGSDRRFDSFKVWVDGKQISYRTIYKAIYNNTDITAELLKQKFPLEEIDKIIPGAENDGQGYKRFPIFKNMPKLLQEWLRKKNYYEFREVDDEFVANFGVQITYVWDQIFAPGKNLHVRHEYEPAEGSNSSGTINHFETWSDFIIAPSQAEIDKCKKDLSARNLTSSNIYCRDEVIRVDHQSANSWAAYIRYIISTGNNWKNGIEQFNLEIKGAPLIFAEIDGQRYFDLESLTMKRSAFKPKKDILVEFISGKKYDPQKGSYEVPLVLPNMRLQKKVDGPANCRKSPEVASDVVISLPNTEKVKILKRQKDWYQVRSGEMTCWTHRKNLSP